MIYHVDYCGKLAGSVEIKKQGLFYLISCVCHLPQKGIYRLCAVCEERLEDLGILIPQKNGYGMRCQIPIKKLGDEMRFCIVSANDKRTDSFCPVYEDKEFERIDALELGCLEIRDGKTGIVIKNP